MNKLPIFISCCAAFSLAPTALGVAPVIIGGPISGTLTNGTYQVQSDLVVHRGQSLVIEAGTQILFQLNTGMYVGGRLISDGEPSKRILFSTVESIKAPGIWKGILLTNWFGQTSILDHVEIAYAGQGLEARGGDFETPIVFLSNSKVHRCLTNGIYIFTGPGGSIGAIDAQLIGNVVSENSGNGILIEARTRVTISRCAGSGNAAMVWGNHIHDNGSSGIRLIAGGPGGCVGAEPLAAVRSDIFGNIVHGNAEGILGFSLSDGEPRTDIAVQISNNLIFSNRTSGVNLIAQTPTAQLEAKVINNTIVGNGGGGIAHSARFTGRLTVRNNVVAENGDGIHANTNLTATNAVGAATNIFAQFNNVFGNVSSNWVNYPPTYGVVATNNIIGTPADFEMNISVAPQFVSTIDFHPAAVLPVSLLINAGTTNGAPATDLDGNPRHPPVDIGCYEAQPLLSFGTLMGGNNGEITTMLSARAAYSFRVEASSNLNQWETVSSHTNFSGKMPVQIESGSARRFLRAVAW